MIEKVEMFHYKSYEWSICCDFKVIRIILVFQFGYKKNFCFLCTWGSRARDQNYNVNVWPNRKTLEPGNRNVSQRPLVDPQQILLPPLYEKLGIVKNFVEAKDKNGEGFRFLKRKFPKLSEAKIEEGVFQGPQIRQLMLYC